MAGLLAILPLALTVAIVVFVTGFIEGHVGPNTALGRSLESLGLKFASNRAIAYVIGWACVLGAIFVLGLIVELGAKRFLQRLVDAILKRIPLVKSVYGTSKQLVEMFDRKDEAELKAMSVVFCNFGKDGGPGVLALMPSPERFRISGQDYHIVIIPTAPVPFGGGLVFMPTESVVPADMSVDGLMSIYVSMGVTTPQYLQQENLQQEK
jgi:uncharacterized membrane protein